MKRAVQACEIMHLPASRTVFEIYSRGARADILSESISGNVSGLADSRGPVIYCDDWARGCEERLSIFLERRHEAAPRARES